jgi:hypothetical protein
MNAEATPEHTSLLCWGVKGVTLVNNRSNSRVDDAHRYRLYHGNVELRNTCQVRHCYSLAPPQGVKSPAEVRSAHCSCFEVWASGHFCVQLACGCSGLPLLCIANTGSPGQRSHKQLVRGSMQCQEALLYVERIAACLYGTHHATCSTSDDREYRHWRCVGIWWEWTDA